MTGIYGVVGIFDVPEEVVNSAREIQRLGFTEVEAFSPFPIENLEAYIGPRANPVAAFCLLGGVIGALTAFFMQYYAYVIDFPLNVGGRPLNSWPAFIPITFELTILFAAFSAVIAMIYANGLPKPYHPIFNSKKFSLASGSRFCLCVKAKDQKFELEKVKEIFKGCGAQQIEEVPL